ncbi:KGK domain-containing protein [Myxosarcina sp. GI1]|uniref:KGK domain-containing protein n=1 Tax=Myxosarcina sp. GI1 TaxID=1541065 RepID=UPI000569FC53|nr:KGK domain-containing protein [Myxosarcina sp. GI1]
MEDNFQLKECSEDDVLEFNSGTYRIKNIMQKLVSSKDNLSTQLYNQLNSMGINIIPKNRAFRQWFDGGIDCEILKLGAKNWKKGKVRLKVTFEFIPDEPEENISESLLDEIRQTAINNNNK